MIKTQHCPNCEADKQELSDFKQKVSDAVEMQAKTVWDIHCRCGTRHPIGFTALEQFIIKPKPEPDGLTFAERRAKEQGQGK